MQGKGDNMQYDPLIQHEYNMKLVDLDLILTGFGQNGLTH